MANITEPQVRAAAANLVASLSLLGMDAGVILTDERFTERTDEELIGLIINQEPSHLAKGWLFSFESLEQIDQDDPCELTQVFNYVIETIYPYQDKMAGGAKSADIFKANVMRVIGSFNMNRELGLGATVNHRLPQMPPGVGFARKSWMSGSAEIKTHYTRITLAVEVLYYM